MHIVFERRRAPQFARALRLSGGIRIDAARGIRVPLVINTWSVRRLSVIERGTVVAGQYVTMLRNTTCRTQFNVGSYTGWK